MRSIKQRIEDLNQRVAAAAARSGRKPHDITIVVASKYAQNAELAEVSAAGLRIFGENKVQDLLAKQDGLGDFAGSLTWHFIGHLQSNKVRQVVPAVDLIHSVDSVSLAQDIDKRAAKLGKVQKILVEVNLAADPAKWGFAAESLRNVCEQLLELKSLSLEGLMCMAPIGPAEQSRKFFRSMVDFASLLEVNGLIKNSTILSMGMTNDFEVAIEEGSTMIRVGSAIFQEG